MSEPRPDPGSEAAGEPEYGNDTGFASAATDTGSDDKDWAGPTATDTSGDDKDWAGPTSTEDADDADPGRGAD